MAGGAGSGGGGIISLRSRQVPVNQQIALTALVTLRHVKMAGDLGPLWSPNGMPKWWPAWSSIVRQVWANDFGLSLTSAGTRR